MKCWANDPKQLEESDDTETVPEQLEELQTPCVMWMKSRNAFHHSVGHKVLLISEELQQTTWQLQ